MEASQSRDDRSGRPPRFPEPGDRQQTALAKANVLRHLAAGHGQPFVEAVRRNQAATFEQCLPVRRLFSHRFAAGVNHPIADLGISRPKRHQAPLHLSKHPLPITFEDDRSHLRGLDVVPRPAWIGFQDGELEFQRELLGAGEVVASAHSSRLEMPTAEGKQTGR